MGVHKTFADELSVTTRQFIEASSIIAFRNAISFLDQMLLDLGMDCVRADVDDSIFFWPKNSQKLLRNIHSLGSGLTFHTDKQTTITKGTGRGKAVGEANVS